MKAKKESTAAEQIGVAAHEFARARSRQAQAAVLVDQALHLIERRVQPKTRDSARPRSVRISAPVVTRSQAL
jgi:hypothetical protein